MDDAVGDFDYEKIKTELYEAKKQLESSIKAVKKIKPFYGDSCFKDESIKFFLMLS